MSRALALAVLLLAAAVAVAPVAEAMSMPGADAGGATLGAAESTAEKAVNPSTFQPGASGKKTTELSD
ncbi:hypothetical protein BRADI_4g27500v3 [Brachypodium distachyon]|uniref:Uncharacterized protein n=1 Tax=Brachypodium distachyon TaxID=15368 RepID=I1IP68_BRADI|nr:hypothetical protein BRADI_4g27500v3 [Brachypodium distachyon]